MKKIISTDKAPAAIGPYSQAIEINNLLFVSGQIPLVPETGNIIEGGIKEQTQQVLKNIAAILDEAGYSFDQIVKTTIYLTDMSLFSEVNEIYAQQFSTSFPARSTIAVKGLPKGALIEIEVIAAK